MRGKITGRRTDNRSLCHPIQAIGAPTSIIPLFLRRMPAILAIYSGSEQASNNVGLHTQ